MARVGGKDRGLFERPKVSGIWWIRYMDGDGRERREKVGPKGLARRVYEKRKTEIRQGRYFPPERRRAVFFEEIAEDFLTYAEQAKRSARDDRGRMRRLLGAFRGRQVESISRQEVEDLKRLLACELSPATVNRHLALLKTTFNRAVRGGKATGNPTLGVKLLKENNIRVRCLSTEEERKLLGVLPAYLQPLVVVAAHTGMRRSELLGLRWEDIDFYTKTIHVRQGKSGEGRRVPMNQVVEEALRALRQQRIREGHEKGDGRELLSPYVFCTLGGGYLSNLSRDWYPALRRAGIQDLRFHDLRHTFASRLVMAGVDLYTVKELLGHKTTQMTSRYAHLSPDHQRRAVEALVNPSAQGGLPNYDQGVPGKSAINLQPLSS